MTTIPILESSYALQKMKVLYDEIRSDEVRVATRSWGYISANTRLRVALAKMARLCKEARKEIPPRVRSHDE